MPWQRGRNSGVETLNLLIPIPLGHLHALQAVLTCTGKLYTVYEAEGRLCRPVVLQGSELLSTSCMQEAGLIDKWFPFSDLVRQIIPRLAVPPVLG